MSKNQNGEDSEDTRRREKVTRHALHYGAGPTAISRLTLNTDAHQDWIKRILDENSSCRKALEDAGIRLRTSEPPRQEGKTFRLLCAAFYAASQGNTVVIVYENNNSRDNATRMAYAMLRPLQGVTEYRNHVTFPEEGGTIFFISATAEENIMHNLRGYDRILKLHDF